MTNICLATVVYPEAEAYFSDFFTALGQIQDVNLVIAEQGATNIRTYAPEATIVPINPSVSIPAVRAALFNYLKCKSSAEIYVFTDIDDRMRPNALQNHRAALQNADFSYGDQVLFENDFDRSLDQTLFNAMDAPNTLTSPKDLEHGNCVGLSALALTRSALEALPENLPDDLVAVDWFCAAQLIKSGMTGAKTGAVTDYRLQGHAWAALKTPETPEEWLRRSAAAYAHFRHMGNQVRAEKMQSLISRLKTQPQQITQKAKEVLPQKRMWYEDVVHMAETLEKDTES